MMTCRAKRKKVLLIHRYYYPDTPAYAVMLKRIAETLTDGQDVEVLTSYPSYYGSSIKNVKRQETVNGVDVYRIKLLPEKNRNFFLRLINTFLFAFLVFFKLLLRSKYDLIMVATTPPIIMASVVRVISAIKGNKFIYHCQDIYPEIAFYNNDLKSRRLFKILQSVDKKNNQKASKIVVLSQDMKDTLMSEREVSSGKIVIINNFIRTNVKHSSPFNYMKFGLKESDFIIAFCGNLGKLQNLDIVIDVARKCGDYPQIKFVFIGEGVEKNNLIKQAGDLLNKSIFFLGYLTSDIATNALKHADLGVISVSAPTYKTAYPSKTMTYLNVGLPVLAIIHKTSELAQFIVKSKAGVVASPSNSDEIKNSIIEFYKQRKSYKREEIQQIAQNHFGEKQILLKWDKLFKIIN